MRLAHHVAAKAAPGVPFAGRLEENRFRVRPVWTWTPATISPTSSSARWALSVPLCTLQGVVSPLANGTRIDVRVGVGWPFRLLFVAWVGLYLTGLTNRPVGTFDLAILPGAVLFLGVFFHTFVAVARGSITELCRITVSQPAAQSLSRP